MEMMFYFMSYHGSKCLNYFIPDFNSITMIKALDDDFNCLTRLFQ